jgi:hypothetical protein
MTYLVAITRWSASHSFDAELPVLARAMGLSPYDARLRLLAPLPVVLRPDADLATAQALVLGLRERGYGAVACEAALVPGPEQAFMVREFEFGETALALGDPRGRNFALPYTQFMGLIVTAEVVTEISMVESSHQKLALGRAALTGGIMRRKTVKSTETQASSERQRALYLFMTIAPHPIVFKEHELHYHGLGEPRAPTRRQSFTTLVDWLRRYAPHAPYDDRLASVKRRPQLSAVEAGAGKRVETSTNSAANQLAAYLWMHAYVQGQV